MVAGDVCGSARDVRSGYCGAEGEEMKKAVHVALTVVSALLLSTALADDQSKLQHVVNAGARTLTFDWPMVRIGTAEYAEGPTGATVFRFERRVLGAVDVRGGAP